MPMWGKSKGGILTDAQIADIVAYLRSFVAPVAPAPAPLVAVAPTPVVYSQTTLALTQSPNADGSIVLSAYLAKFDGTSAAGVPIVFSRPTVMGDFELGTAKTDDQGKASITLRDQPESARYAGANFAGTPGLGSSAALLRLDRPVVTTTTGIVNTNNVNLSLNEPLLPPEGSLITPNPPLVPTTLFVLVVGFIWSIYGFVVYQVVGIWKNGRPAKSPESDLPAKPQENVLSIKKAR